MTDVPNAVLVLGEWLVRSKAARKIVLPFSCFRHELYLDVGEDIFPSKWGWRVGRDGGSKAAVMGL